MTSHSHFQLQTVGAPPRSASSNNLGSPNLGGGSSTPRMDSAGFLRAGSSATPGSVSTNAAAIALPASPAPPPSSPRPAVFPTAGSSVNTSLASTPISGSHPHQHGNYDSRLVANTINRIESTSGIGGAGNSVPSSSGSASANSLATHAHSNHSHGHGSSHAGQNANDDAWVAVCLRTLPLFNGEGQRGYIEDLNDLVSLHVKRTIERRGISQVLYTLASDLTELLAMGMLTLNAKLMDLSDDKLLIRITEVWNFFFIGCLPYIEGIFLPLRTDPALRQLVLGPSGSRPRAASNGSTARQSETIDIRSTALRSFRDHLVLPIVDRLAVLFSAVPDPESTQPLEPLSNSVNKANNATARTASARRLQMVSILSSLQSGDERQAATEALGKALRAGMDRRPSFAPVSSSQAAANGLYGAGYYNSTTGKGGRVSESEKKAWRRGRQIHPGPSAAQEQENRARSQSAKGSMVGADGNDDQTYLGQQRRQMVLEAEAERRYIEQLRSPEFDTEERIQAARDANDVGNSAIMSD